MKKYLKYLIFTLVCLVAVAEADSQYIFDDSSDSTHAVHSDALDNPVTIKRTYTNFTQVTAKLSQLGFNTVVKSLPENPVAYANIEITTTVKDFVIQSSSKFGYSWTYQNNTVTFSALNPVKPKPIIVKAVESPVKLTPPPQVAIANNWVVEVKDRTIRNTLVRWAKKANYQLEWQVKADFPVTSNWPITGSFENAVNKVLQASRNTDTPIKAQWYENNVIVIVPLTNQK